MKHLSIYISKVENGDRFVKFHFGADEWELPKLFKEFENWLFANVDSIEAGEWIADIGFSPRESATGGGPIISTEIMASCLKIGMAIYISEYGE